MMKKIALWLAAAAVIGGVIGISALQELNITMDGETIEFKDLFNGRDGIKKNVYQEEKLAINQLDFLSIESISEDIKVIYEERTDVMAILEGTVTQSEKSRLPELTVSAVGNRAEIKIESKNIMNAFNFVYNVKMTVKVPNSMKPKTEIASVSGNIQAPFYNNAVLRTVSGNIQGSGNDKASVDMHTTSGNVSVQGNTGEMKLKSVSGEIEATVERLQGNVEMKTTSGDCLLVIKDPVDGFKFNGESTSGNIEVLQGDSTHANDDSNSLNVVIGNGKYKVDMQSLSGNIKVTD